MNHLSPEIEQQDQITLLVPNIIKDYHTGFGEY